MMYPETDVPGRLFVIHESEEFTYTIAYNNTN